MSNKPPTSKKVAIVHPLKRGTILADVTTGRRFMIFFSHETSTMFRYALTGSKFGGQANSAFTIACRKDEGHYMTDGKHRFDELYEVLDIVQEDQ